MLRRRVGSTRLDPGNIPAGRRYTTRRVRLRQGQCRHYGQASQGQLKLLFGQHVPPPVDLLVIRYSAVRALAKILDFGP